MEDKDFDIEKYRIEHPMDYLLAMQLILDNPNKDEIFKQIYAITRLHIPNILYKYYSFGENKELNDKKIETLLNQQIYMSDIESLNDPFDSNAYFYKSEAFLKYKEYEKYNGRVFDNLSGFTRVSAFTSNGVSCMPMWAHYSNNHQGFCVSYDMKNKNNTKLSGCMFPIQYSDKRIDITDILDKQINMVLYEEDKQLKEGNKEILINDLTIIYLVLYLGNIKHITWNYEKEFRCSISLRANDVPYVKAIPQSIYIGENCLPKNIKKLVDIAYQLGIEAFQMTFDEYDLDYNLIPKKLI